MKITKIYYLVLMFVTLSANSNQFYYNGSCGVTKDDFDSCLEQELLNYDKQLNKIYKKLKPNKQLVQVQKNWIKFKESDCNYMAKEVNSGKYYDDILKACLINATQSRIKDLQRSYFYSHWYKLNG